MRFLSKNLFSTFSNTIFPSLTITPNSLIPNSPFSKRQADYLTPDPKILTQLEPLIQNKKIGLVAHFYMDPELQGIINKLPKGNVLISDSLVMGQGAVEQAKSGIKHIIVLGVDFMSENVRALLSKNSFSNIPVYRLADKKIGCSLAESAEKLSYQAYLMKGKEASKKSLHVIYINTSLALKGKANKLMPTVTCTSSNVVRTILQGAAEDKELNIYFGPDSYMGRNIAELLVNISRMEDAEIKKLHPAHNQSSIKRLIGQFHYFKDGICIVHHHFDDSVVQNIRKNYLSNSYVTAHLEVPGEMFTVALEKQRKNEGVVGSTSDILNFIVQKTKNELKKEKKLRFVLGTESGMITMIVDKVQNVMKQEGIDGAVEIIFPVSQDAMTVTEDEKWMPGVSQSEGCSINGGCASCPYMKMNSLEKLVDLCEMIDKPINLEKYLIENKSGNSDIEEGVKPILNMQHFMKNGRFSESLIKQINGN